MPAQNPSYDLMLLLDTAADEEQRAKVLAEAERILEASSASTTATARATLVQRMRCRRSRVTPPLGRMACKFAPHESLSGQMPL